VWLPRTRCTYATRVTKPENVVVTLVARRPDRMINPEGGGSCFRRRRGREVCLPEQQRLRDCRLLQGLRLSSSPPGLTHSFGGVGRTIMEWVLTS
jgi:hypothetical protein